MNEEILNETIRNQKLGSNDALVMGGITCVSLLVGSALGYILAKKNLQPKYEALAQQEIAEARAFYNKLAKDVVAVPTTSIEEATTALRNYQGRGHEEGIDYDPDIEIIVETNVFAQADFDDMFDLDAEVAARKLLKPDMPYIISHDEFMEAEPEYDQTTLTWYDGDRVLSDEQDTPVDDVDLTVGDENMLKFGHGSGNSSTVFIRNNRLKLDFEVVKSDGKFAHEVLGLEHSDQPSLSERRNRIHKFRGDNE